MRKMAAWTAVLWLGACAGQGPQPGTGRALWKPSASATEGLAAAAASAAPAAAPSPTRAKPPIFVPRASASPPDVERRYHAHLVERPDLDYPELERELSLTQKPDRPLSFQPEAARFAALVEDQLALSPEERAQFRRDGAVNVDHDQRYSMAAAYYAIFTRDLPVLVTTDSILHALHRSYDEILKSLETSEFASTVSATLEKSHEVLRSSAARLDTPHLKASAADVDVYLTVAQNLLSSAPPKRGLRVPSALGNDDTVRLLLKKIAAQTLDMPPACTELYGGRRELDYSQFKPRGHYTESADLTRYFQALMWLGRADTGFVLAPPDKNSGIKADAEREFRSAALLALVLEESGELERFEAMSGAVDFLVGSSDSLTVPQMLKALHDAGVVDASGLEPTGNIVALQSKISQAAHQQIRSQVLTPPPDAEEEVASPLLFQLFGQRFALDSFVLSRVVYDSITFKGRKMKRQMPSGLDVMAALGNDEATRLLRPQLEEFHYSSNLLAARRTVDELRPEEFEQSVYGSWLGALRKLDDVPARGNFPEAMKRAPFARKQLQTQLASWAELRHDTVLYAKQSYSDAILCEYPEGYVEPYPNFFAELALLSEAAEQRLSAVAADTARYAAFFQNFTETMRYLERLAQKELEAKPFSDEESGFLKKTIAMRPGCGPPDYDGWYTRLFFGGEPEAWKPTVSDVHTDPTSGAVLQEGVGDANFFVLAVDNQRNHTAYVGPVYSYYEFTRGASERLTDSEWQKLIQHARPARPSWWTSAFPAKAQKRTLADATGGRESDPRVLAAEKLLRDSRQAKVPEERKRIREQAAKLLEAAQKPPPPTAPKAR